MPMPTSSPMQPIDRTLARLASSRFRAGFHLTRAERAYFAAKGPEVIRSHAEDFVRQRLAPSNPANDGRQTPMSGHPAFRAMHACACCCRGCLEKWHRIPRGRALTDDEQAWMVNLLMAWMECEMAQTQGDD